MSVKELFDKLRRYDPETEVQAVCVSEPYLTQNTNTDEPIIEILKTKKNTQYLVIRA